MYRINRHDKIVYVNDKQLRFSYETGAPDFEPENVLNKSLWNFINEGLNRELYEMILRRARNGDTISFSFRFDVADYRLFLEMTVTALQNGDVQFETKTLRRQKHESPAPHKIIAPRTDRGGEEFLRICGWCKRIDIEVSDWREVENALKKLKLFESGGLPQLTHGICRLCYQMMTDKLVRKRQPGNPVKN